MKDFPRSFEVSLLIFCRNASRGRNAPLNKLYMFEKPALQIEWEGIAPYIKQLPVQCCCTTTNTNKMQVVCYWWGSFRISYTHNVIYTFAKFSKIKQGCEIVKSIEIYCKYTNYQIYKFFLCRRVFQFAWLSNKLVQKYVFIQFCEDSRN